MATNDELIPGFVAEDDEEDGFVPIVDEVSGGDVGSGDEEPPTLANMNGFWTVLFFLSWSALMRSAKVAGVSSPSSSFCLSVGSRDCLRALLVINDLVISDVNENGDLNAAGCAGLRGFAFNGDALGSGEAVSLEKTVSGGFFDTVVKAEAVGSLLLFEGFITKSDKSNFLPTDLSGEGR